MKRYGNLWQTIITFENLYLAAKKAQKGKRYRDNVLDFNYNLATELFTIQQELTNKTYQPGQYRTFHLRDPKSRLISAAPYRDRVVHHALCNIIVPIFEKTFIRDSYANREGYGTHRALRRFINFFRNHTYILQCDIKKYFSSIDHQIIKQLIQRKIKCQDTLWLIDKIIDNSNPQEPIIQYFPDDTLLTPIERKHGLPIGNLTSQFFANIYLNPLDHFIKEKLKCKAYVRYVDDFALFSHDPDYLKNCRQQIEDFLIKLRLKIHPVKSQLFSTNVGATFLGFRIFHHKIRVKNQNIHRGRRRLKRLQKDFAQGKINVSDVITSLNSWNAHLEHGDTWRLRQQIFKSLIFKRD
ncbi:MAG: reverse transcriptase domain-containing protein [Crocosphaera sp.]